MCIHRYIAVAWAFWIAASNQKWIAKSRYVLYGYAYSTLQGYIFANSQLSVVSRQSEPKIFTSKKASHYLLGGCIPTPLKNMSSSIGMIRNPIYGKIKNGNQTTNQLFLNWDSWIDGLQIFFEITTSHQFDDILQHLMSPVANVNPWKFSLF